MSDAGHCDFALPPVDAQQLTTMDLRALGWPACQGLGQQALVYIRDLARADIGSPVVNDVFITAAGLPVDRAAQVGLAYGSHQAAAVAPAAATPASATVAVDHVIACGGDRPVAIWVADSPGAVLLPLGPLSVEPVGEFHPRLGLYRVRGEVRRSSAIVTHTGADWGAGVATARVALAADMSGAARAMLEIAAEHARHRVQFGRPIGTFQAVQHRLAEIHVALETTERLTDLAVGDAVLAAAAKISAGRLADVAVKGAQQVLGGVGFTADCAYHRYAKRVLLLDKLCGSGTHLAQAMGEYLLRNGDVPRLPRLSFERAAHSLAR